MERKHFLKSLLLGAASVPALLTACSKETAEPTTTSTSGSGSGGTGTSSGNCAVAPTETEGPFPTKVPSSYVRSDIRDGKTGYQMDITITLSNSNASCAALAGGHRRHLALRC